MNKVQAILLFSIVFVAGCIGQNGGGGAGGPGCVVTGPTINPSTADPGTTILMEVTVKNQGGAKCENVRAELIGLPNEIKADLKSGPVGDLLPAEPSRGIKEGEEFTFQWFLTGSGRTVDVPYDIGVKVTYGYTTTLEGNLKVVSSDWFRRKGDKGGIDFTSTTGGPITMSLTAPSTIISGGQIVYSILVTNNGAGDVEGRQLVVNAGCKTETVSLLKDQTRPVRCLIPTGSVPDYDLISVTASTHYTYSIEKVTTVTILKNPVIGEALGI